MKLLGGDTHLAAQSKLTAVGEAGGAIVVHSGAVYRPGKICRCPFVGGDDSLAVASGVPGDMRRAAFTSSTTATARI